MATSSVKTECKKYRQKRFSRRLVRDAVGGSEQIKMRNEVYLPIPSGYLLDDTAASQTSANGKGPTRFEMDPLNRSSGSHLDLTDLPYYHRNPAYMGYLQRATFPDITKHTLRGLVGTATKKPLEIKVPSVMNYILEETTKDGMNIHELFAHLVSEVLQAGNNALVVDINPDINQPYICSYAAETLINWRELGRTNELSMGVFNYLEDKEDESDEFAVSATDTCLVYSYGKSDDESDKKLHVIQRVYYPEESEEPEKTEIPSLQGVEFERIPVVPVGAIENTFEPQTPPLLGIADVALAIYRKDADLSNAEYMTCNPNFVITGESVTGGAPVLVGATVALILENPASKAFYTTTDTSGLNHVLEHIDRLYEVALMYGASLSGPSKKGVEATDTVKERKNSQSATLVDVVRNVAKAIEEALELIAELHGASTDEVVVTPNLEFSERFLSPQMIDSMIRARMGSSLSLRTILENFKESGFIDDVDEELKRISMEGPADEPGTGEEGDDE